ncbi:MULTISPECIES: M23 family metallopeptidase [Clostridium]|uniref:M23 family metallopeptidase n=1 Tax=Clostridium TaxID=1485 RepID=UPI0008257909|nr:MULTISPECIES: M23 family metallopeptidase [Clostridium]PJI09162.1 M23 family peptidase [Clostridium sp. CT7]
MNNDWKDNKQNKVTDFLKRNVFYIVLFLCLCIIGGVSVYMNIRSNTKSVSVGNQSKVKSKVQSKCKTSQVSNNGNAAKEKMENAKQVNQNQNLIKKDSQAAQTSTANIAKKSFVEPVENGKIVVKFDTWHSKDGKYTNIPGEYISPSKNSNVVATCDGVVKGIDGGKVTILNAQNGYTTVYDNLDEKSISLKVNDNVKQGQVLGKIGDSNYSNKLITDSSCLYFEIDQKQKDGTYLAVDPEKILIH